MFNEQFLIHDDLRYYVLKSMTHYITTTKPTSDDEQQIFANNIFMILHHLKFPASAEVIINFYTPLPEEHPVRDMVRHYSYPRHIIYCTNDCNCRVTHDPIDCYIHITSDHFIS